MKLYEQVKHTDIKSQYGDHNTGIEGFNDGLDETFKDNIYKERPVLDKWNTLRSLMQADIAHNVHYSSDKDYEHCVTIRYLKYMDELEERDRKELIKEALEIVNKNHEQTLKVLEDKPKEGFYYTGIPDFDKKTWEKMLENLEGLS